MPGDQTQAKEADPVNFIMQKEPKEIESGLRGEDRASWKSVIVKEGDNLSKLAAAVYGRTDEDNLKLVRKNNPEIRDINRIAVGQKIIFPPPYSTDFQER